MRQIKQVIKKIMMDEEVRNYLVFGVLATMMNLFLYFILRKLQFNERTSNITAIAITMNFAFMTNKIWVFKSKCFEIKVVAKEYYLFILGRIISSLVDVFLFDFLLKIHLFEEWVNKGAVTAIIIVLNYVLSKKGAFKKTSVE